MDREIKGNSLSKKINIPASESAPGVYIVRIENGKEKYSEKLVLK